MFGRIPGDTVSALFFCCFHVLFWYSCVSFWSDFLGVASCFDSRPHQTSNGMLRRTRGQASTSSNSSGSQAACNIHHFIQEVGNQSASSLTTKCTVPSTLKYPEIPCCFCSQHSRPSTRQKTKYTSVTSITQRRARYFKCISNVLRHMTE